MNWDAWSNMVDKAVVSIIAICVIWLLCAYYLRYKNRKQRYQEDDNYKILKPGERATVVIHDPAVAEKIELYQERQDLYNEQILTYKDVINGLNEELESVRVALRNGSVKGSYEKLKRKEGVLTKRIADYRLRVNRMVEKSNELTEKIQELARKYGKIEE